MYLKSKISGIYKILFSIMHKQSFILTFHGTYSKNKTKFQYFPRDSLSQRCKRETFLTLPLKGGGATTCEPIEPKKFDFPKLQNSMVKD